MQEALHRADGAIAVCCVRQIASDTESHFAAVAPTLIRLQHHTLRAR
jgi:hypothetical protein